MSTPSFHIFEKKTKNSLNKRVKNPDNIDEHAQIHDTVFVDRK